MKTHSGKHKYVSCFGWGNGDMEMYLSAEQLANFDMEFHKSRLAGLRMGNLKVRGSGNHSGDSRGSSMQKINTIRSKT